MVDEKLVKLAIDAHNGTLSGEYSLAGSQEVLRKAMIEANNGKTTMNWKDIRDGKCNGLFSIIEVLVNRISEEGLAGDEMFSRMVEDRNLSLGDSNVFHVEKDCLFTVATISDGNQSVRRQRIEAGQDVTVNTSVRAIKIYEEVNRVLSGRVDFNKFVDAVSRSFTADELNAAYVEYLFPIKKAMTTEAGNLVISMSFVANVESDTGESDPVVLKTQPADIMITETDGWSGDLPDDTLNAIDEKMLELQEMQGELKNMQDHLNNNKADGLMYEDHELQLTANGEPIGNSVEVTGGDGSLTWKEV